MRASRSIVNLAVVGVGLLSAGVASAADPVQLRSRLADVCLDGLGNNAAAVVNPCSGSQSQRWSFNAAAQIESAAFPGDCLSIASAADGTPAILKPCQDNSENERWSPQPNGWVTNALGPCLNIFGGVANPGTPVIGYHCTADVADEQWDSIP